MDSSENDSTSVAIKHTHTQRKYFTVGNVVAVEFEFFFFHCLVFHINKLFGGYKVRALTLASSNEEMRVKSVAKIVLGFKDQVSLCFFLFDIRRLNVWTKCTRIDL